MLASPVVVEFVGSHLKLVPTIFETVATLLLKLDTKLVPAVFMHDLSKVPVWRMLHTGSNVDAFNTILPAFSVAVVTVVDGNTIIVASDILVRAVSAL